MSRQVTITLDDDVAEKFGEKARRNGASLGDVVNETLRRVEAETAKSQKPFEVYARDLGAKPGVNFDCAWKLHDDLDGIPT